MLTRTLLTEKHQHMDTGQYSLTTPFLKKRQWCCTILL